MTAILEQGATLGAYRLIRELGAGGMGAVWLGEHAMLGRRAAIKVLHDSFSSRPEIVTRFFNEARAATAIADPGIVQIFDFGHHTDGSAYIVMELLEGESLESRLRKRGALGLGEVLRLMRQLASSLGAAHARGIVHRDLKPDNVFIVFDPEVVGGERTKILDFGIAKLATDDAGIKTQTSALMGTPMFMSPEQCRGAGGVDQRSDVYSLACMMFLLLAGRTPFQAEGVGELIIKHVCEEPPSLLVFVPDLPAEVDALVLRCLAKDPALRPASGKELAAELGTLLERFPSMSIRSLPIATAATVASGTPKTTLSSVASQITPQRQRRHSRRIVAAGLAVACAVAAVVFATTGGGEPDAVAPAASSSRLIDEPHPRSQLVPDAAPARAEPPKLEAQTMPEPAPAKPDPIARPAAKKLPPRSPKPPATPPTTKPDTPAAPVSTPVPEPSQADDFDERMKKQRERSQGSGGVRPVE